MSLGDTLGEWEKFSEAETWYLKCIDLSQELGIKGYLVEAQIGLAEVKIAIGMHEEAQRLCDEADTISETAGMRLKQAACLRLKGMLRTENEEWATAEENYSESLKNFNNLKAEPEVARTQYRWAEMLLAKGDVARGKKLLESGLMIFKKKGMKLWAERCRKALDNNPK